MKTKKSYTITVCKRKYRFNCTDEIVDRMWQSFINIIENYDKILTIV
jgi:hypothetical protein